MKALFDHLNHHAAQVLAKKEINKLIKEQK